MAAGKRNEVLAGCIPQWVEIPMVMWEEKVNLLGQLAKQLSLFGDPCFYIPSIHYCFLVEKLP